jgi:hypothetical protein
MAIIPVIEYAIFVDFVILLDPPIFHADLLTQYVSQVVAAASENGCVRSHSDTPGLFFGGLPISLLLQRLNLR